jgi:hypothetical protein
MTVKKSWPTSIIHRYRIMERAIAVLAIELGCVLQEKAVRRSLRAAHRNGMQYSEYNCCYLPSVYCCAVDCLPDVTSSCGVTFYARNTSKVIIVFPLFSVVKEIKRVRYSVLGGGSYFKTVSSLYSICHSEPVLCKEIPLDRLGKCNCVSVYWILCNFNFPWLIS